MKKILALILALVMAAAAGLACAEKMNFMPPAEPADCSFDIFVKYFDALAGQNGFSFIWDGKTAQESEYEIHTAYAADGGMMIRVYCLDEKVAYIACDGTISTVRSDQAGGQNFGRLISGALGSACMSLYLGENGEESVTEELVNQYTEDLIAMMDVIARAFADTETLNKGAAGVSSLVGYPVGMQVRGLMDDTNVHMNVTMIITAEGGQLTVE